MKFKRKSNRGFTLVEALVATAVLAIFVSMAIVGTSALFGTGEQMMAVSKAAVLGSDAMQAVMNEVRFGEKFSLDEEKTDTILYNSTTYGEGCKIVIDEKGQLTIEQKSSIAGAGGTTKTFFPIGSAAYDEVRIKEIGFTIEESKTYSERQIITCTLSVTSDGTDTLWQKSVTIVPLCQKTVDKK